MLTVSRALRGLDAAAVRACACLHTSAACPEEKLSGLEKYLQGLTNPDKDKKSSSASQGAAPQRPQAPDEPQRRQARSTDFVRSLEGDKRPPPSADRRTLGRGEGPSLAQRRAIGEAPLQLCSTLSRNNPVT